MTHEHLKILFLQHASQLRDGMALDNGNTLTEEQLDKVAEIGSILDALPPVSIDEELDAVLEALIEMRERDG